MCNEGIEETPRHSKCHGCGEKGRLAWFGHLERKDTSDCVSGCRGVEVAGSRGRGRPVTTWQDCISADMARFGLRREMAQDRVKWRSCIVGNRPTRVDMEKGT